tara:strand:+ start:18557 stop:19024 length:468 start_codon:yes stop_codon:yes gene_type:complete
MKTNYHIDNIDLKILSILSKNAKMPYTEVAKKVLVSGGTVHVRMKKLENMGVVKGTRLQIDYAKLGYKMKLFMGIYLEKSYLYRDAVRALKLIPEVIELHAITGKYTIFAKILCKDAVHLRKVLDTRIHKVKGITRTESFLSIEESFKEVLSLNN